MTNQVRPAESLPQPPRPPRPQSSADGDEVFWDVSPSTYRLVWFSLLLLYVAVEIYLLGIAGGYVVLMYIPSFSYYADTFHLTPADGIPVAIALYGAVAVMFGVHIAQFVYYSMRYRMLLSPSSAGALAQRRPIQSDAHSVQEPGKVKPLPMMKRLKTTPTVQHIEEHVLSSSGFCGVRGVFFEPVVMMRELVEIAIQTSQAYQCSKQTTKFWVNATFAILIIVNCYSSPALHRFGKSSVSAYRVTVLGDLALDLIWFAVIPTLLWYPYSQALMSSELVLYRDTYIIEGIMELPALTATSYFDALVKLWPPVSTFFTLRKIELLTRRARKNRPDVSLVLNTRRTIPATPSRPVPSSSKWDFTRQRIETWLRRLLLCWGHAIVAVYIYANFVNLPACSTGCQLVLRPWFESSESTCQCAALEIYCLELEIEGTATQIHDALVDTNTKGLLNLIITHCPALQMPSSIQPLKDLYGLVVFNCTIDSWEDDAAITSAHFPHLGHVLLVHTFASEISQALLGGNLPPSLCEIDIVASNLSQLPEDLHEKWPHVTTLLLDHGDFSEYPMVLSKMPALETISFYDNHISHIPDDAFEGNPRLRFLVLSENPLRTLPVSVSSLEALVKLFVMWTNVEDAYTPLVNGNADMLARLLFFGFESPMCTQQPPSSSDQVSSQREQAPWLHCEDQFFTYSGSRSYGYYPLESKLAEKQFNRG